MLTLAILLPFMTSKMSLPDLLELREVFADQDHSTNTYYEDKFRIIPVNEPKNRRCLARADSKHSTVVSQNNLSTFSARHLALSQVTRKDFVNRSFPT